MQTRPVPPGQTAGCTCLPTAPCPPSPAITNVTLPPPGSAQHRSVLSVDPSDRTPSTHPFRFTRQPPRVAAHSCQRSVIHALERTLLRTPLQRGNQREHTRTSGLAARHVHMQCGPHSASAQSDRQTWQHPLQHDAAQHSKAAPNASTTALDDRASSASYPLPSTGTGARQSMQSRRSTRVQRSKRRHMQRMFAPRHLSPPAAAMHSNLALP